MNQQVEPVVFGAYEYVSFPALNIENVVAKVDTGADSGAIHCSSIEVTKRASDGVKVLRYTPLESHDSVIETDAFIKANVRSSTGHQVTRYIIETKIVIHGKEYSIRIGLSDRSVMQTEILIGRRFLSENNILVDVRINQDLKKINGGA